MTAGIPQLLLLCHLNHSAVEFLTEPSQAFDT